MCGWRVRAKRLPASGGGASGRGGLHTLSGGASGREAFTGVYEMDKVKVTSHCAFSTHNDEDDREHDVPGVVRGLGWVGLGVRSARDVRQRWQIMATMVLVMAGGRPPGAVHVVMVRGG